MPLPKHSLIGAYMDIAVSDKSLSGYSTHYLSSLNITAKPQAQPDFLHDLSLLGLTCIPQLGQLRGTEIKIAMQK